MSVPLSLSLSLSMWTWTAAEPSGRCGNTDT
jgi:hypothetical protein